MGNCVAHNQPNCMAIECQESTTVSESPSVTGYKACPFCGGTIYSPANIKKNKALTACANNKCPIFGVTMTTKQWQTRAL